MARRRKTQLELSAVLPTEPAADDAQVPSDAVAVASVGTTPRCWRVVRDTKVSLFGHLTTLPEGTLVSAAEYGPEGVARIAEQAELVPA